MKLHSASLVCLLSLTTTLAATTSHADDASTNNLIAGYSSNYFNKEYLLKIPIDTDVASKAWQIQSPAWQIQPKDFQSPAINDTQKSLTDFFKLPDSTLGNIATNYNFLYSFSPVISSKCQTPLEPNSQCTQDDLTDAQQNFNFNTYFGPLVYSYEQQKNALSFIQFSATQIAPFNLADISKLLKKEEGKTSTPEFNKVLQAKPELQDYLAQLRLYAAIQSVITGNLYQFYNERVPFTVIPKTTTTNNSFFSFMGTNFNAKQDPLFIPPKTADNKINQQIEAINEKDKSFPDNASKVSPLMLENYMATWRLTNAKWWATITSDTPATLQRQMVVLQAENLAETHRLRMSIDRLTVTMTLMLQQNSVMQKQQLEAAREKLTSAPEKDDNS